MVMLGVIIGLSGGIGVVHQLVHFHTEIDALLDTCCIPGDSGEGHVTLHFHGDHHHDGCGEEHCTGPGCSVIGAVVRGTVSPVSYLPLTWHPCITQTLMYSRVPQTTASPFSTDNRRIPVLRI